MWIVSGCLGKRGVNLQPSTNKFLVSYIKYLYEVLLYDLWQWKLRYRKSDNHPVVTGAVFKPTCRVSRRHRMALSDKLLSLRSFILPLFFISKKKKNWPSTGLHTMITCTVPLLHYSSACEREANEDEVYGPMTSEVRSTSCIMRIFLFVRGLGVGLPVDHPPHLRCQYHCSWMTFMDAMRHTF